MRILVSKLVGDATVLIYNKQGELIHSEAFFGKVLSQYDRTIPVADVEFGCSKGVFSGEFEYKVVA